MEKYSVEGHADLARDPHTNSIINVNKLDYEQYVSRRATKEEKNQQIQTIEDEVANMKSDINEIKFLLKELLNGSR
jgi:hypothetical protein